MLIRDLSSTGFSVHSSISTRAKAFSLVRRSFRDRPVGHDRDPVANCRRVGRGRLRAGHRRSGHRFAHAIRGPGMELVIWIVLVDRLLGNRLCGRAGEPSILSTTALRWFRHGRLTSHLPSDGRNPALRRSDLRLVHQETLESPLDLVDRRRRDHLLGWTDLSTAVRRPAQYLSPPPIRRNPQWRHRPEDRGLGLGLRALGRVASFNPIWASPRPIAPFASSGDIAHRNVLFGVLLVVVLIVVAVVARRHNHPAVVSMCVVSLGGLLGAVVLLASTPVHYYLSFIWVNLVIWIVGICVWLTLGLAVVTAIRPRLASMRARPL